MDDEILSSAINKYGEHAQIIVAIEELSELIKELTKHERGADNCLSIAEEIADVQIMCRQLEMIFDVSEQTEDWRKVKINRLKGRLEADK